MYHSPKIANGVLKILQSEIEKRLRSQCEADRKSGRLGGVTFIQRFGSHLNVHAHYHGVLAANSPSRKQVTALAGKRLKSGEALVSEENDETNQASQPPICAPARGPPEEVIDHQDDEWSQRLGIEEEDRDQRNWC